MELDPNNCFTLTSLVNKLNEKFKTKKSGKLFTSTDVEFYIKRNKLPNNIGGNGIELIKNEANLKIYKLNPEL